LRAFNFLVSDFILVDKIKQNNCCAEWSVPAVECVYLWSECVLFKD